MGTKKILPCTTPFPSSQCRTSLRTCQKHDFCWQGRGSICVSVHWNQERVQAGNRHRSAPWLQGQCFKFLSCHKLLMWKSRLKLQKNLGWFIHVSAVRATSWNSSFTAFPFPLMSSSPSCLWEFTVKQVIDLIWFEYFPLAGRKGA